MIQTDLIDWANTRTRKSDPDTSREAALSIYPSLTEIQGRVLEAFTNAGINGLTDEELNERFGSTSSTYRTRRSELVDKGLLMNSGFKRAMRNGRMAVVWVKV